MGKATSEVSAPTLGSLIGWETSPDEPAATPMIARIHAFLGLPLHEQTVESIRLLIGQDIGLDVLVPIAVRIIEQNPLASGDTYRGDLASTCMQVRADFWVNKPDLWHRLHSAFGEFDSAVENFNRNRAEFESLGSKAARNLAMTAAAVERGAQ